MATSFEQPWLLMRPLYVARQRAICSRSLLLLPLARRHANPQVVRWRIVPERAALIVLAVHAEAVQQIAILGRTINECLAAKEIVRHVREIAGRKRFQLFWIASVLVAVGSQSKRNLDVALHLFATIGGVTDLGKRGHQ